MKLINFILEKIQEMPKFPAQILLSGFISIAPALPISLVDRFSGWYIDNQVFLTMVFAAIVIDWAIGSYVHYEIKHDFSMKKNLTGLLVKGFSCVAGYVLFEMVHQIVMDVQFIAVYFKVVLQLTVILFPVLSALQNVSIMTGGKFPPEGMFKKFAKFNKDLDLNTFKTQPDETTTDSPSLPATDSSVPQPQEDDAK